MKKDTGKTEQLITAALLALFFVFFWLISRWMPVAGDDWGYAYTGMTQNPLTSAAVNYMTWSGRFLAELWGFVVAPHKGWWNLLNPLLFTGILAGMIRLVKKAGAGNIIPVILLAMALILTVPEGVRMETYTWIMGTTYVIPLFLFTVYINLLRDWLYDDEMSPVRMAVMMLCSAAIPLYMENAAALLVGADMLVLIWLWFKKKEALKRMLVLTVIGTIGLILIRFSPGAMARMARDHAEFNRLSLFGKIGVNWFAFIDYTFMRDYWLTRILCVIMILRVMRCRDKYKTKFGPVLLCVIFAYGILQSYAWTVCKYLDLRLFYMLADISLPHSLAINTIGYMAITAAVLYTVYAYEPDEKKKWLMIFLYLCAMGANAVMLISPIFGARSSLYTLYMLMLFTLVAGMDLFAEKTYRLCFIALAAFLVVMRGTYYLRLYRMVDRVTARRQAQIQYYHDNPDVKEAWLIAYPDQSVHSANIDDADTYHMDTFKMYYDLEPDVQLHFYWLTDYSPESIANG